MYAVFRVQRCSSQCGSIGSDPKNGSIFRSDADGWAEEDRTRAIELYTLNTRVSESLYIPLQMLEVSLRNRIHSVMTQAKHERWFQDTGLLMGERLPNQIAGAIRDIEREGKEAIPGRFVAALTFSFWTFLFGKDYETLWQTTLHRIARQSDGRGLRRKDFSGSLTQIRLLRNRIAHHEPILNWDLPAHYGAILKLTRWLSPVAADWCEAHSRFTKVHPRERIKLRLPAVE